MASLKEIKGRISSIKNIWKITSAMRRIASAKLHRAQNAVANMLPYEQRLISMLSSLLASEENFVSPYIQPRKEVKRAAIVAFSSNSSLCGAFNVNILKKLNATIQDNYSKLHSRDILIFPVGRKIYDAILREGYKPQGDFRGMAEKPNYADAAALALQLLELYSTHQVDHVTLIYNHFKNTAIQIPTSEVYLPFSFQEAAQANGGGKWKTSPDYILEPSRDELIALLLPKVLELKIFAALLDSAAAEHAARTMAMQLATDNADELLDELTLLYNKSRQQAITNELLDIISGTAR
ncbi:MAG: F0F1 ATP synthase subunit gamma [Bacteroidales bacterium]|nr:F0F1 ATP synthase subunit gamma [Bacteroidales bacterium]MCL2132737.1 F0F1 ATP synthase subunit gamma [Bacteroidales bacterium]